MKKKGFLASFILGSTLSSVFNFLKFSFIMCGASERKEIWFMKIWKKKNVLTNMILSLKMVEYTTEV